MAGNDQRQTTQTVACKIGSFGINTHHTIGKVHRRIRWYQQMADISHVWIYILDGRLRRSGFVVCLWRT